jgi:hypothetical protein
MDRSLRERLCEMTLKPIAEQAAMLEWLRGEFAHTIEVLDSSHPIESYTCAVHAFHLVGDAVYTHPQLTKLEVKSARNRDSDD